MLLTGDSYNLFVLLRRHCFKFLGTYEVMFDDGVQKTIKAINVDVGPPLVSSISIMPPGYCNAAVISSVKDLSVIL